MPLHCFTKSKAIALQNNFFLSLIKFPLTFEGGGWGSIHSQYKTANVWFIYGLY